MSQSYCDYIVQLTEKYRQYNFGCLDPEGQYTVKCKTSCNRAGYKVCGESLVSAISLAAGKEDEQSNGDNTMKASWVAAFASIVALFGVCAGVALGRSRSGGNSNELAGTVSSLSPTQRLDSIEHKQMDAVATSDAVLTSDI
jgi:hypothetical protein